MKLLKGNKLEDVHFDGDTYAPVRDKERLTSQILRVYEVMEDGKWRTLQEICAVLNVSSASVSARLRDLRKPRFGGHKVERRYRERGVWEYCVQSNED